MNKREYALKQIARQQELLQIAASAAGFDPDVWALEWMITQIQPDSPAWRRGHVRALRRAIKALNRENSRKGDVANV